jgi:hypothetical protein
MTCAIDSCLTWRCSTSRDRGRYSDLCAPARPPNHLLQQTAASMLFFVGFRFSRPPLLSLVVRQLALVTSPGGGGLGFAESDRRPQSAPQFRRPVCIFLYMLLRKGSRGGPAAPTLMWRT